MSYTIPDMEWPVVTKTKTSNLLSERYGTTNGRWHVGIEEKAAAAVYALLTSYKVPIYHLTIDEITDMHYDPKSKDRVPYIEYRYIYVWTFSAPKTPVVHVYYQGGDKDTDLTCHYEKTVEATLLTEDIFGCEKIIARMQEL